MTIMMGLFRSHTTHPTSHPSKPSKDIKDHDPAMDVPSSHASHLTSHLHIHKPSWSTKDSREPEMGISRSRTDPLDEKTIDDSLRTYTHTGTGTDTGIGNSSGRSSGSSSPRRKTVSMDIVRNIRERPTSAIPKYHLLAEQLHKYKMRNCPGMYCTDEEMAGIKEMKKWDWKHAHHPGEQPPPVGPRNETLIFEGLALQQLHPEYKKKHGLLERGRA